jgi:hypothetical protein
MACLDELNQSPDKTWIGISRTGEMRKFETLGQFQQYQEALGCRMIRPAPYVKSNAGQNTTPTGFLEFKPRDEATQARFDAMSDQWEGVNASDAAVKQGLFIEDSAQPGGLREKKSQPLLIPPPRSDRGAAAAATPTQPTNDICSIQ